MIKFILIIIGSISVGLGVLGVFLPLLPTTPFLLLAAACYMRSSEKFYEWLIRNKWLGGYIKNYREKKGITLRAKILSITTLWLSIGYSVIYVIPVLAGKIVLLVIAAAVTYHLLSFKTISQGESSNLMDDRD